MSKRVIVDHAHAMRQHKAFAVMVIVFLLVVLAVWFVQIRLMVRTVDFSKLQQSVEDAGELFRESADNAGVDDVAADAAAAAAAVETAVNDARAAVAAQDAVRAEVAARAAASLADDTNPSTGSGSSTTSEQTTP